MGDWSISTRVVLVCVWLWWTLLEVSSWRFAATLRGSRQQLFASPSNPRHYLQPPYPSAQSTPTVSLTYRSQLWRRKSPSLRMFNPFGGMFSSAKSSSLPSEASSGFNDAHLLTWIDLEQHLRGQESAEERLQFDAQLAGKGPANAQTLVRYFETPSTTPAESIRLVFYRDSAAWCPYCEKVWLYLEEKRIPYRLEKVPLRCYGDKPSSFMQMNPSGGLPVLEIDGRVVKESNDIIFLLEQTFTSYKSLLPQGISTTDERFRQLMRLERQVFSVWFAWLTSPQDMQTEMHRQLLAVEQALSQSTGAYFLGDEISIIDILFTPFLERMAASLPYFKGFQSRDAQRYPFLYRWYEAMDQREAYRGIKSDYYTHVHDLPPQIGKCHFTSAAEPFKAKIDGGDWDITIPPEQCFEPMIPQDVHLATREAVRKVLQNHEKLIAFTTRPYGNKKAGVSAASAPLADPDRMPEAAAIALMDSVLRDLLTRMLGAPESDRVVLAKAESKQIAKQCLLYLRDRIGVPRDMSVHAARQLRGHINAYINAYC